MALAILEFAECRAIGAEEDLGELGAEARDSVPVPGFERGPRDEESQGGVGVVGGPRRA